MKEFLGGVIGILLFLSIPAGLILISSNSSSNTGNTYNPEAESNADSSHIESEETENIIEYNGYECTKDCSGHEAGYEWAMDNDVCDEYFDGGNSESFAEGVRSYAEEGCGDDYYYYDY